jgi:hypothetical protein
MPFLFHARPAAMRGDVLYPLNRLKAIHPDVYEREQRKYDGRERLLELRIPFLDVRWNDALHLSPIHPARLAAAWRAAGVTSSAWEREFFAIPVERIDASRAVWFASGALSDDAPRCAEAPFSLPVAEVAPFDPDRYEELVEAPRTHHEYLRRYGDESRLARPFAHVPHVLVAAPVDVSGARLVRADQDPPRR